MSRVEIETALRQNIPIIPVLVGTAGMPSPEELPESIEPLAYRNAGMVRPGRDFRVDIERLIEAIRRLAGETENAESQVAQARPEQRREAEPGQRLAIRFADLARDPSILSDAQIGSYQIRELLGSGGSGAVYRAHNPRLGQEACIKLSYPLLSHAEAIRRAIGRGIRGVVAMNHPNISRIFDFDQVLLEDGSSFFVAMELIAGSNLDDWAKNLPAVDESFLPRLQVARLIALALQAAHDCSYFDDTGFQLRGVMHGDVKPSNIRVRPDNTPVVIDWNAHHSRTRNPPLHGTRTGARWHRHGGHRHLRAGDDAGAYFLRRAHVSAGVGRPSSGAGNERQGEATARALPPDD
jgi:hypothetical protein